jgi:hypothetical protein
MSRKKHNRAKPSKPDPVAPSVNRETQSSALSKIGLLVAAAALAFLGGLLVLAVWKWFERPQLDVHYASAAIVWGATMWGGSYHKYALMGDVPNNCLAAVGEFVNTGGSEVAPEGTLIAKVFLENRGRSAATDVDLGFRFDRAKKVEFTATPNLSLVSSPTSSGVSLSPDMYAVSVVSLPAHSSGMVTASVPLRTPDFSVSAGSSVQMTLDRDATRITIVFLGAKEFATPASFQPMTAVNAFELESKIRGWEHMKIPARFKFKIGESAAFSMYHPPTSSPCYRGNSVSDIWEIEIEPHDVPSQTISRVPQ